MHMGEFSYFKLIWLAFKTDFRDALNINKNINLIMYSEVELTGFPPIKFPKINFLRVQMFKFKCKGKDPLCS